MSASQLKAAWSRTCKTPEFLPRRKQPVRVPHIRTGLLIFQPLSVPVGRSDAILVVTQRREMAQAPASPRQPSPMTAFTPQRAIRQQAHIQSGAPSVESAGPIEPRSYAAVAKGSAPPAEPTETHPRDKPEDRRNSQRIATIENVREPKTEASRSRGWPRGQFTPGERVHCRASRSVKVYTFCA